MSECIHPHDLQSFVDGEIYGEEAARIQEHLKHCPACVARVEAYEQVRYTLLRARRVRPAEDLLDRILSLLRRVAPVRRLSCREARVLASAYIDDELSLEERETLEAHLFSCDDCFMEYARMRDAAAIMRATPPAPASEGLKRRILAAVAQQAEEAPVLRPARTAAPYWHRALGPSLAAAAVVVFAFGLFQLSGHMAEQSPAPTQVVATVPDSAPLDTPAVEPEVGGEQAAEVAPSLVVETPGASATSDGSQVTSSPAETSSSTPAATGPAAAGDGPVRPDSPAAPAATRERTSEPPAASRARPADPGPARTMVASAPPAAARTAVSAGDGGSDNRSRLAAADRSRSATAMTPRTPSEHSSTPAPLRGPLADGARDAPRLTRPEPRPAVVALEDTPEDDLQPTEWVEKRPETATRLYSYNGGNDRRLADAGSRWTRDLDAGDDGHAGLASESWPTN